MATVVRWGFAGALVCVSFVLVGYTGFVDRNVSRFRSVGARASWVTISGYDDQAGIYSICAYQQSRNPTTQYVLGCAAPQAGVWITDPCGRVYYRWTMTVALLATNEAWFKDAGGPEYTRVFVSRNNNGGGIYTATADELNGQEDDTACYASQLFTRTSISPLIYFNGAVPTDLTCGASRTFAGCPFTCNQADGCDIQYGTRQIEFSTYGARVNYNGQDTSRTSFDHYGANNGSGTPPGEWSYMAESGNCSGGTTPGLGCDSSAQCGGGGICSPYWTVMRRNTYGYDSLNVRRGENRRNAKVEAWVKMRASDTYNREIGLVQRWYNRDNYFAFSLTEYTFDVVKIHKYQAGGYSALAWGYPVMNLTQWTRLGFTAVDLGSFTNNGQWVPNGACTLTGIVNGTTAVSAANVACGFAPYGGYGTFTYFNSSAQFWDLDARACLANGTCL